MIGWLRFAGILGVLVLSARPAAGHEVRPGYLELVEQDEHRWLMTWKVPARGGGILAIEPVLPASCRLAERPRVELVAGARVTRSTIDCGPAGVLGQELRVAGLQTMLVDVLVRLQRRDGIVHSYLLRPDSDSVMLGSDGDAALPVLGYLVLGVEHILLGVDHLLFVLALLFIVRHRWRLIKTITAFTAAHSITLALATLGVVRFPSQAIEAVIALSIVFLAYELVRMRQGGEASLTVRHPWVASFGFGLLHGFGFAGALAEIGLPQGEIPAALTLFNVGVELGQIAFIAAVGAVIWLVHTLVSRPIPAVIRAVPAHGIGAVASFWVIERVASFWAW